VLQNYNKDDDTIIILVDGVSLMNHFDSDYIIRVPKNCGIVGLEYKGKLDSFGR